VSVTEVKTLLTVPEAAIALRIGRSTAYDLAHAWLDSAGTKGLPVVVIGGSLRVPVAALERLFAIGGFGPAWQSGLDGRRSKRTSTPAAGDVADACAATGEPPERTHPDGGLESGASEPVSRAEPAPRTTMALDAESAPPEPQTPELRRSRRPSASSSGQLSLFDAPET